MQQLEIAATENAASYTHLLEIFEQGAEWYGLTVATGMDAIQEIRMAAFLQVIQNKISITVQAAAGKSRRLMEESDRIGEATRRGMKQTSNMLEKNANWLATRPEQSRLNYQALEESSEATIRTFNTLRDLKLNRLDQAQKRLEEIIQVHQNREQRILELLHKDRIDLTLDSKAR